MNNTTITVRANVATMAHLLAGYDFEYIESISDERVDLAIDAVKRYASRRGYAFERIDHMALSAVTVRTDNPDGWEDLDLISSTIAECERVAVEAN